MRTSGVASLTWSARLALLGVTMVLAGCGVGNRGDSVAVLGDSITSLDQADLQAQLGGDYQLVISGNFGQTVQEVMPEASFVAGRSYDQVIINLGTNDVIQGIPPATSMQVLQQMIGKFPSAKCIHLVNINENMVDQKTGASLQEPAKAFNSALDGVVKSGKRLDLIDWSSVAGDHLNSEKPPWSTLTQDSVHPTAEGNKELNNLYRDALSGCSG
jgi:lysophospholipase L1-like esterase